MNGMTILEEILADPARLESRFLNPDASGLVLDRLSQPVLERLVAWYQDPRGGDGGMRLLDAAPLMDAWLQGLVPNLPPGQRGEGSLRAMVAFMAGMAAGLWAREDMEEDAVFHVAPDLESSLGLFGIFYELPRNWDVDRRMEGTDCLVGLFNRLVELEPSLLAVHWALIRLARRKTERRNEDRERQAWLRFIFHAGQLAAGVDFPDPAEVEDLHPAFHRGRPLPAPAWGPSGSSRI